MFPSSGQESDIINVLHKSNLALSLHLRRRVSDFITFAVMIIPIYQSTQCHISQDCTLLNFFKNVNFFV